LSIGPHGIGLIAMGQLSEPGGGRQVPIRPSKQPACRDGGATSRSAKKRGPVFRPARWVL